MLHVTWTELSETDALFHTFCTGNVDLEYVNEHMNLELHLRQVQSMVSSFSIREGHTCCRCGDESCMIPTFKHLTNVQGADDAETVKLLMDVMRDFVKHLVRLGCTFHPKTLRIQAIVDDSNIFAGLPCAGSLALPSSSSRSSFMPHNSDGVDDPSFCNASLQRDGQYLCPGFSRWDSDLEAKKRDVLMSFEDRCKEVGVQCFNGSKSENPTF